MRMLSVCGCAVLVALAACCGGHSGPEQRKQPRRMAYKALDAVLTDILLGDAAAIAREEIAVAGIRSYILIDDPNTGDHWPNDYVANITGCVGDRRNVIVGRRGFKTESPCVGLRLDRF